MRRFFAAVWIIFSAEATAQELWLRPEKYFFDPNEVARINVVTGEDFIALPSPLRAEEIETLELIFRNGRTDIRRHFSESEKSFFQVNLSGEGIYQAVMTMKPGKVNHSGTSFQEYVKQFGLEEVVPDSGARVPDSVTVNLTRIFKCYVRVGKQFDKRPEQKQSFPVEILPDKNPLLLNRGERITFTILKNGKPAFGVRVKIWNRWNNRTTLQHIYTGKDGTVNTAISSPGDWMVSVVNLKPAGENDFEGQVFNLIFGYR